MSFNIVNLLKQLSKDSYSVFSYLWNANTIKNKNDGQNPKAPYNFFFTPNKKIQIKDEVFSDNLLILLNRLYNSEKIDSYSIELAMKLMLNDLGLGKFDLYDDNLNGLKKDKIQMQLIELAKKGTKDKDIYNKLLNEFDDKNFEIEIWNKYCSCHIINYFHSIIYNLRNTFIKEMGKCITLSNGLRIYPGVIKIISLYNVLLKTGYQLMDNFEVDENQYRDYIRKILNDPNYQLNIKTNKNNLYRFVFNKLRKQKKYMQACNKFIECNTFNFSDDDFKYQIDQYIIKIFRQSLNDDLVLEIGKALNIYSPDMNEEVLQQMEDVENQLYEDDEMLYQVMDEQSNEIETQIIQLQKELETSTDPDEKKKITEKIEQLETHLNSDDDFSDEDFIENNDSVFYSD